MRLWLLLIFLISGFAEAKLTLRFNDVPENTQKEIHARFPQLFKDTPTLSDLDELIKWTHENSDQDIIQLWQLDDGSYELKLNRRIRVKQINWQGLSSLTETEALQLLGVQINDIYNRDLMASGAERVSLTLRDLGYINNSIQFEEIKRDDGHLLLSLKIIEGRQTLIRNIEFESPNINLNKSLQKKVTSIFQEPLNRDSIEKINKRAKEYLYEERYSRAEITGPEISFSADETQAQLKFKMDKIEKYNFNFKGLNYFTPSQIRDNLDLGNFYSANADIGAELSQKIRAFYQSKGFARVEIQTDEKNEPALFIKNLTFTIQEGPRVKIDKIQFLGRFSRDEKYYRNLFLKNAPELTQSKYYSREDMDVAVNNFKLELQNQGHLLMKIQTIRTPYNKEKDKVSVLITFDEGPQTQIQSIEFTGNKMATPLLLEVSQLSINTPLQLNMVDKALSQIRNYYHENGYLEMRIENEKTDLVTYSEDNTKSHLHFKIFEGPQVRVQSIVIEGNIMTRDQVIFNELDFSVDEILTPQKIEDSTFRLQRTGYFGSVEIKTLEEKTAVAERTVIIRVTERDPGLFNMGFGLTNERQLTIRGYTGIAYSNLYGTGRGISFRLEGNYNVAVVKYPEYKATVGYLEPYLFQTRNRGRVSVTRSRLVTDTVARKASESVQTAFSVERDFTTHITGIWDLYTLASSRDFGIDGQINEVLIDIATTGFSVDIDYRDNLFNPTKGTLSKFNIEYGSPELRSSPTIEFWKTTASFTYYYPVYKNSVVWANQWRAGFLQNLSQNPNGGVPYDKKGFILGGQSTIRGFEAGTDEVFPNKNNLGIATGETFYLRQSATMGLFKSEVRFPIYGNISGATFYDGGTVRMTERAFEDNYRDSVGFGFRYNTPVGPLSLEYGIKLDRKAGEDSGRYHISFGNF